MQSYFEKENTPLPGQGEEYYPAYRLLFIPFLIVGLHNFECITYTTLSIHPFLAIQHIFMLLISGVICLQVYILTIHTAPKWQQWLYKLCLFLLGINIILGFFNKYVEHPESWFTDEDEINIRKQDVHSLEGLKLLDTTRAFVVGKYEKRIAPLISSTSNKPDSLTYDQQFMVYEKEILPKDFRVYWALIDTTGNNTSERLLGDYYDWQYPDYNIYVYIPNLECEKPEYTEYHPNYRKDQQACYTTFGSKGRRRDIEAIGRVFKASGGWPVLQDRLYKYYKAIEEYFFPTYVRRDLMNDPYFLIERGQYKEARAGLSKLPPNRRAFCEEKLKALGK
ncbi:hypothetical protein [Aquimarina sp. I32.4]|uniref:hypothetical protein n=1 Tax=Aquimarina sp. I32.4 TaxID=2053903 RepID=UPI000CDF2782|nr:hypothetical protein [Aquimarina sp. I32.4]